MLRLTFTHRYYDKVFCLGGLPLDRPTRLVGYSVVPALSDEFRAYDTKYWRGGYGVESRAEYCRLGPGPYLILCLATDTGNGLAGDSRYAPTWFHWTSVRRPWARVRRRCANCRPRRGCPGRADGGPCERWMPAAIPTKYRRARGRLIQIMYRPERGGQ